MMIIQGVNGYPLLPRRGSASLLESPGARAVGAPSGRLREDALALKEAWLRERHPEEDDAAIRRRLRAWQLHGRACLD